jgi:hypothetical protein
MWIVSLRVRSAARLDGDQNVHLIAEAEPPAPVRGLKIRNMRNESEGGSCIISYYISGITCDIYISDTIGAQRRSARRCPRGSIKCQILDRNADTRGCPNVVRDRDRTATNAVGRSAREG